MSSYVSGSSLYVYNEWSKIFEWKESDKKYKLIVDVISFPAMDRMFCCWKDASFCRLSMTICRIRTDFEWAVK